MKTVVMNTNQLQTICENVGVLNESFLGVFPCDHIPPRPVQQEKDIFCIVNFDPSYKDGSHWVTLIFRAGSKKDIYFDSYGRSPPSDQVHILRSMKEGFVWNSVQLQHPLSTACGQWCIFFVCAHFTGHSLKNLRDHFSDKCDLLKNDFLVNEFVNSILPDDPIYEACNVEFVKKQFARRGIDLDHF